MVQSTSSHLVSQNIYLKILDLHQCVVEIDEWPLNISQIWVLDFSKYHSSESRPVQCLSCRECVALSLTLHNAVE